MTILQIINADKNLSMFNRGLKSTSLVEKLNEVGPFTILGPVNLALQNLSSLPYEQFLAPANSARLFKMLCGYVVSGKKMFDDFKHNQTMLCLNGEQIKITIANGDTFVNDAKILSRNRQGSNGVVHSLGKTYDTTAINNEGV